MSHECVRWYDKANSFMRGISIGIHERRAHAISCEFLTKECWLGQVRLAALYCIVCVTQHFKFHSKSRFLQTTIGLMLSLVVVDAGAQIPGSAEPGRIEKQFDKPTVPKSTLEPMVPEMEKPLPPEQAEKVKFTLTKLIIEGSSVYKDADFHPFYENYLRKEISLKTIYDIGEAITAKYGEDGYSLSRAAVPAQRIKNGVIRISIIEGFINNIIIEGDLNDKRGFFKDYEAAILASRPLRTNVLERHLLLGNDLNGVSVKSVMKPSTKTHGASTLVLQMSRKVVDASAFIDNRGTKTTGPLQFNVSGSVNNVTGMFERTTFNYIQTAQSRELKYFSFGYDQFINGEGTMVSLNAVRSLSTPGTRTLTDLEMQSKNNTLSLTVSHPFIRTRSQNLTVHSKFEYNNSESFQLTSRSSHDRIRSLRVGADYDYSDEWEGVNLVSAELSQGFNIFHHASKSNPLATRSDGTPNYSKLTLDASRTQQLPDNWALHLAVTGQQAAQQLLSGEECGVGGKQFGRAYDSSEITGDRCAAGSVELRYTPEIDDPKIDHVQLYGFYDIGGTWSINAQAGTEKKGSLASTGLGVRYGIAEYISGSLEIAQPLTRPISANNSTGDGGNSPRLFFRLMTKY